MDEVEKLIEELITRNKESQAIAKELYAWMDWYWNSERESSVDEIEEFEEMLDKYSFLKEKVEEDSELEVAPMP